MSAGELLDLAAQAARISVPYVLAALGGAVCERAGVVNLALEGLLLAGAFAAAAGSELGGVGAGGLMAVAAGLAMAGLHGLLVLRLRADQVVTGVALNLLAIGLTRFLLKLIFHSASSSPAVPGLEGAAPLAFAAAAFVAAAAVHGWIERTPHGLRLRAVGEHPQAADSLGVDVLAIRWTAVLAAGALAGLGGAYLALDNHGFVDRMSGGRGYIALAAVIFGKWRPLATAAACLAFGLADALQLRLQTGAGPLPRELVQVLPHALTIVVLAGFVGRARAPAALGVPFER
jgi:simple sugar transport system permease protein